jgi:hypothetical protein
VIIAEAARHLAVVQRYYPDAHTTVEAVDRHLDLFNGDHDMGSFTSPRRLVATDLRTGVTEDLLPAYRR